MTTKDRVAIYSGKVAELKALTDKAELTDEETVKAFALRDELKSLQSEIETAQKAEALKEEVKSFATFTDKPATQFLHPSGEVKSADSDATKAFTGTYTGSRCASLKAFKGDNAEAKAYGFGRFIYGYVFNHEESKVWCQKNGIGAVKAASEGTNTAGGVLVPPQFDTDIIDLREQYGVFRRNTKVKPMTSDVLSIPRRTGGLTVYNVGEGVAFTESDKAWDMITLTASKWGTLSYVSSELNEDAFINVADDLAQEIAYAFANKEDECGFNGDGTNTYFGVNGVRNKIKGLSSTIANIAGLQVGTGNAYNELTLVDFEGVAAKLPLYADGPNAKWFCHKSFYYNVMLRVALAAGGVTQAEVAAGNRTPSFLGYPVEFSQVMPSTEANSQVCCLLGDLALAAKLGDRRGIEVAQSMDYRFANDQLSIRGIQRIDINVHDVGNADATVANRVPGPIVGLITAAS